jgi:hypothetical protein
MRKQVSQNLEFFLDELPILPLGIETVLSGVVTGTWTAFETLATDLWVTAVNARPMTLGTNAYLAPKRDLVDTDTRDKLGSLSIDILRQYGFNLGSSMGTMMHEKRIATFNTLDDIRNAYAQAFCIRRNGTRSPLPEVKNWFSGPDYEKLRVLEALRHVLVHRGGRADKAFLDRVEDKAQVFSVSKREDIVVLDGAIVRDYCNAGVKRALVLLRGVDIWLQKPE